MAWWNRNKKEGSIPSMVDSLLEDPRHSVDVLTSAVEVEKEKKEEVKLIHHFIWIDTGECRDDNNEEIGLIMSLLEPILNFKQVKFMYESDCEEFSFEGTVGAFMLAEYLTNNIDLYVTDECSFEDFHKEYMESTFTLLLEKEMHYSNVNGGVKMSVLPVTSVYPEEADEEDSEVLEEVKDFLRRDFTDERF